MWLSLRIEHRCNFYIIFSLRTKNWLNYEHIFCWHYFILKMFSVPLKFIVLCTMRLMSVKFQGLLQHIRYHTSIVLNKINMSYLVGQLPLKKRNLTSCLNSVRRNFAVNEKQMMTVSIWICMQFRFLFKTNFYFYFSRTKNFDCVGMLRQWTRLV